MISYLGSKPPRRLAGACLPGSDFPSVAGPPLQSTLNQDYLCGMVVCFRGSGIATPSTYLLT